jgi:hypothetical protein
MTGNTKLKVINLFAGPGAGKSTTRASLFAEMKYRGLKVEEVTEYAKDLTWENHESLLSDQLMILANQNRKLERLKGKVEWVVSDSPLLLGLNYRSPYYFPNYFEKLIWEIWDTYDNYNFFLKRQKEYNPVGRKQTEEEALFIDSEVRNLLSVNQDSHQTTFKEIMGNRYAALDICKALNLPS